MEARFNMAADEYEHGEVLVLNQAVERDGIVYPAGTECVVISGSGSRKYTVELLEPQRVIITLPASALEPVAP